MYLWEVERNNEKDKEEGKPFRPVITDGKERYYYILSEKELDEIAERTHQDEGLYPEILINNDALLSVIYELKWRRSLDDRNH